MMRLDESSNTPPAPPVRELSRLDEGGLRPPDHIRGWRRVWWWFDFLILVKLARLRFIAILVVIGVVITQWDTLVAHYEKWTRSAGGVAASGHFEWFCPMHPSIIRDNAKDKCPICFMPLSKRAKGSGKADPLPAGVVSRVQLTPYRVVLAGVQTYAVETRELSKEIRTVGYVEFNERDFRTVSARVKGRLDRLLVNETGVTVAAGQPLAELYSPELLVTVQNLLDAKRTGNSSYLANARTRLELLGIEADQVDDMLSRGTADTHIVIRSPIGGHIITKYVREGQYVDEGMPLYEVADLSTVWVEAQVYEEDLAFLQTGQRAAALDGESDALQILITTPSMPGTELSGRLELIYPHADPTTRTITVRFEVDNPPGHPLRPGVTADVVLRVRASNKAFALASTGDSSVMSVISAGMPPGAALAVPESAVIDTGSQRIVYRETEPGVFEGVEVVLGPRMVDADGMTYFPVIRGLEASERIVTAGSFLVDAETRLNPAAGSIYFGGSGGSNDATGQTVVRATTPEDPDAKITAALAKLAPAERAMAQSQKFCPVLNTSRLGSMGAPVKLDVDGETVFVCCNACKPGALEDPTKTKETVARLRQQHGAATVIE